MNSIHQIQHGPFFPFIIFFRMKVSKIGFGNSVSNWIWCLGLIQVAFILRCTINARKGNIANHVFDGNSPNTRFTINFIAHLSPYHHLFAEMNIHQTPISNILIHNDCSQIEKN